MALPQETRRPSSVLSACQRATSVAGCALLLLLVATCHVDKITNNPPPVATLGVAPAKLTLAAAAGSAALQLDSVGLKNAGEGGALSWSAAAAHGSAWLSFNPRGGSTPGWLHVQLNPAGLAPGTYNDSVIVSAGNAAGSPAAVPVEFVVHPCVAAAIALDAQLSDSLTQQSCAAPHRPGSFAQLYSFTGRAGDSVSIVMSAPALDGYVVLDTATSGDAPPLAENDQCAAGTGACLLYQLLRAAGSYTVEATSGPAAATGLFTLSITRPRAPAGPDALAQLTGDGVTVIALGGSVDQPSVVLRGTVSDPDVGDTLRLQVEALPVGTAFTGTPTAVSDRASSGQRASVTLTGLADNTAYHWRARTLDQTGRASAWVSFGGNAETAADFSTAIPGPPLAPTALGQFQSDGVTAIPVGGTGRSRSAVFKATVTDPNPGDVVRLEVEVDPLGTAFSGVPNGSGAAVANGTIATATIAGLTDNVSYHWQARGVDQTGRAGPWASFGGNAETAVDFKVAMAGSQVVFTVQPATTAAGAAITPAVKVAVQDALGNTVTSFSGTITVTLGVNQAGGTLGGHTTVTAVNGVATFTDLSIDKVGTGYTLQATGAGLTTASGSFDITPGPATQLAFTVQPNATAAGAPITPAVQVTARDASGNTATQFTGNITVALGVNQTGAILAGVPTHAAVAGVASFPGLSVNKAGTYTLTATSGTIPVATSASFNITAAAPGQLVLTTPPSATARSGVPFAQQPAVQVQDANGNPVATQGVGVTVTIATGPAGASLAPQSATTDATGLARFTGLTLSGPPGSYTLTFASGTLRTVTSGPIALAAGTATQIALQAGNNQTVAAGTAVPIPPAVIVKDASGNPVAGVAVTFAVAPGNGTITGPNQTTDANGIARVGSWTLATTAGANTLTATAAGLTGSPVTFTATGTAGSAGSIAISAGDQQTATVNTAVATPPAVIVKDQFGNPVAGAAVTFAIALGQGGITGAAQTTNASGIARVGSWTLGRAAGTNTLTATSTGVNGSPVTFTATAIAGAATSIAVSAGNNQSAAVGTAVATPPAVIVQDQFNNPVAGVAVTFAPAAGSGSVSPTPPVPRRP